MALVTAQKILTQLGNRAWSGFNKDDMIWGNENAMQAVTELNVAVRYLMNLEDFPFRAKERSLNLTKGKSNYSFPNGQILNIYNVETRESLTYLGRGDNYDKKQEGKPEGYWVDYSNPNAKLRIYPIPDENVAYNVVYQQFYPVMTQEGELSMEFVNEDDFLNLPELVQELFMDCLVLEVMITNNKDEQDENFVPTKEEFEKYWSMFKKACKPVRKESFTIF